jgi:cell division protein FtsW (lipid II flippase)
VWDTKRQIIWLASGIIFGTFVVYQQSMDEDGRIGLKYFLILETILLIIIAVMFYIYSKSSKS